MSDMPISIHVFESYNVESKTKRNVITAVVHRGNYDGALKLVENIVDRKVHWRIAYLPIELWI